MAIHLMLYKLNVRSFISLIGFYFDSDYFLFNDMFYRQLDGSAMGNPPSCVLAIFIMNHVIEGDDTTLAVPQDKVDPTLNIFNGFHEKN